MLKRLFPPLSDFKETAVSYNLLLQVSKYLRELAQVWIATERATRKGGSSLLDNNGSQE